MNLNVKALINQELMIQTSSFGVHMMTEDMDLKTSVSWDNR